MSDAHVQANPSASIDLVALVQRFAARRRAGLRYQPDERIDSDDPNGCIPKRDLLLASGCRLHGARVLSLGCNAGYYERALAEAAYDDSGPVAAGSSRARPVLGNGSLAAIDLVDTDPTALDTAARALTGRSVCQPRTFASAAEKFEFSSSYDICLFLSLYHHYDRLGAVGRATATQLLRDVGAHCQTMFFETGQSDDTVHGAAVWRCMVEMALAPSPESWLESAVPEYTGYDGWHRLGRNPRTNRLLYAYWHERAALGAPLLSAVSEGTAREFSVRANAAGSRITFARRGAAPQFSDIALMSAPTGQPLVFDCVFTRPGTSVARCALGAAKLAASLAALPAGSYAVVVHSPEALRYFPRTIPVVVDVDASTEDGVIQAASSSRYAGARAVRVAARHRTERVTSAIASLGAVLLAAPRMRATWSRGTSLPLDS